MISATDLYNVLTAVVPLYVAMILAYGSVKWWKIFTPDQCSGINRFVALFAVPLLSFHFIAMNDPYSMNYRFIAADTLQKLAVLTALLLWCKLAPGSSIEWSNTFFSIATLPNTLVMGIPLLKGMYGNSSGTLMVQIVVLQCIIWYTLLLFLFEYRGARLLIGEQFPDNAASIVSLRIDSDIVSLDGREPLETHTDIGDDGRLRVTVRKSTSSRSEIFSRHSHGHSFTPRPSNMTNTEIYSLQSSRNPTPRGSNFNYGDFASMAFSGKNNTIVDEEKGIYSRLHRPNGTLSPPAAVKKPGAVESGKETHMFVWSSSASPVSEKGVFRGGEQSKEYVEQQQQQHEEEEEEEFSFPKRAENMEGSKMRSSSTVVLRQADDTSPAMEKTKSSMPPASVMSRLILIMVWRKLIRNPNTYSSLLGLAWSLFSFKLKVEMPAIVARSIAILSDAGLGMAMFSLGLFMALQPKMIACGNKVAFFAMGVRFLVGPAVMAAASLVVGLRGVLLHIAIVQAALPQGIVPFVFSKEYGVHPEILSTGVIFGMLIALPITLLYYILLEI